MNIMRARQQSGMALIMALITLVVVSVASIAIVRSVDTSNLIAGNYAFKQAAVQVADRAMDDGINDLANFQINGTLANDVANRYFAVIQPRDGRGIPTTIDWDAVQCRSETGAVVDCSAADQYRVQYVIERQCETAPDLANDSDVRTKCAYQLTTASPTGEYHLMYRMIVRVQGPRGTESFFEAVYSGPKA